MIDFPPVLSAAELGHRLIEVAAEEPRELSLRWGNLTALPSEIGLLRSLRALDVSGNCLTSLPPELSELRDLESLRLGLNVLSTR